MTPKTKAGGMKSGMENGKRVESTAESAMNARRKFLAKAGKFAIATPPAMTLLLARSKDSYASAQSGGGGGHGGGDGRRGGGDGGHGGGGGRRGRG